MCLLKYLFGDYRRKRCSSCYFYMLKHIDFDVSLSYKLCVNGNIFWRLSKKRGVCPVILIIYYYKCEALKCKVELLFCSCTN